MDLFQELHERNLIHDVTNNTSSILSNEKVTFFIGFDPTAKSLHIGSLLGIITAIRLIKSGHKAIFLIGGATGLIGDPSGKSAERILLEKEAVEHNSLAIEAQIRKILDNSSINSGFEFVNNSSWMSEFTFISFLRDIGKHISVNNLLAKKAIKNRLESENGISFTEFTYNLIQAFDFVHLAQNKECVLQIGGSDQWGNIVSGIELGRKILGKELQGLTFPLLVKQDGTKFGKTENGTIFLDKELTTPFAFFQFLLGLADEEVFRISSFLSSENLAKLKSVSVGKKALQQLLARELTSLIHGNEECDKAVITSGLLFDHKANKEKLEKIEFEKIKNDVPWLDINSSLMNTSILNILANSNMFSSKTEIRNLIKNRGLTINNICVDNDKVILEKEMLLRNKFLLVRKGKSKPLIVSVG